MNLILIFQLSVYFFQFFVYQVKTVKSDNTQNNFNDCYNDVEGGSIFSHSV